MIHFLLDFVFNTKQKEDVFLQFITLIAVHL
jgi:hypothetical protein